MCFGEMFPQGAAVGSASRQCIGGGHHVRRGDTHGGQARHCGLEGLTDRSRRPYRHANQLPFQIEKLIVQLKHERPSWGAPKIREKLRRLHSDVQLPAISTVHAVLDRHECNVGFGQADIRIR